MRVIPGMQVLIPACNNDLEPMFSFALNSAGPSYIRVPRNDLWKSSPTMIPSLDLDTAKLRCWRLGEDVAFVCAGLMLPRVLNAAEELSSSGISAAVYDVPFVNLDMLSTITTLRQFRSVVTVEDHWPAGGINEMIAGMLVSEPSLRFYAVTAAHRFPSSGDVEKVLDDMGLSLQEIKAAALKTLKK